MFNHDDTQKQFQCIRKFGPQKKDAFSIFSSSAKREIRTHFQVVRISLLVFVIVVLNFSPKAIATDIEPKLNNDANALFIIPYFKSYHFNRKVDFNEDHPTIGFEYIWVNGWGFCIMNYPNSYRNRSTMAGVIWTDRFDSLSSHSVNLGFHLVTGLIHQKEEFVLSEEEEIVEGDNEFKIKPYIYPSLSFLFFDSIQINWALSFDVTAVIFKIKF